MGTKNRKKEETFSVRPFETLRKMLKHVQSAPIPSRTAAPPVPSPPEEHDDDVFSNAMSDVQAITEFHSLPCGRRKPAPGPQRRDPEQEALAVLEALSSGTLPLDLAMTQEYIEWTNDDFRQDLVRQLHAGCYAVQSCIDLHGCTEAEVEAELGEFLSQALKRGHRCVKVIHGRGLRSPNGPVLKDAVSRLLAGKLRKHILAFVTARQCDGGLGALYVLLRAS